MKVETIDKFVCYAIVKDELNNALKLISDRPSYNEPKAFVKCLAGGIVNKISKTEGSYFDVIQCEDCKYYVDGIKDQPGICLYFSRDTRKCDYCSRAERSKK